MVEKKITIGRKFLFMEIALLLLQLSVEQTQAVQSVFSTLLQPGLSWSCGAHKSVTPFPKSTPIKETPLLQVALTQLTLFGAGHT